MVYRLAKLEPNVFLERFARREIQFGEEILVDLHSGTKIPLGITSKTLGGRDLTNAMEIAREGA
jgi:hypothetical protein